MAEVRTRRSWWVTGLILIAAVVLASAFVVRSWRSGPVPTWAEISREIDSERWSEAEPKLDRWVQAHPAQVHARIVLAKVRLNRGKRRGALELLETVQDHERAWLEAQTLIGEIYLQERRASDAEACFRRMIKRDQKAIQPRQRLIYLLSLEGRNAEAREMLWEIYGVLDDPRILVDLVLELVKLRADVRGLGPELEEFLKRNPEDPFPRRAWGMNLLYQGRAAEALPHLEAAARDLVEDPEGRFALAECRLALGIAVSEADALGPCPAEPIDQSQWCLYRGRLAESQEKLRESARLYRQGLDLNPENREARFRLGRLLARMGQAEESRRQLSLYDQSEARVVAVRKEHSQLRRQGFSADGEVFARLGTLCLQAGMRAEARAWFEQVIKIDAGHPGVSETLAQLTGVGHSSPIALARPRRAFRDPSTGAGNATAALSRVSIPTTHHDATRHVPAFKDVTESAGISYTYDCGEHSELFLADTMGGGVGLIDYDRDGLLDIYFVNGCSWRYDTNNPPQPNRLFRNNGDGTFSDRSHAAGVAGRGYGMGCAVADYDNDGDDDLFVTGFGRTLLYRNRGEGTFEDVTESAGVSSRLWTTAAGFGDLDGDGDLDLVVVTYVAIDSENSPPCRDHAGHPVHCAPGRYPAQDDLLYRNNGNGTFTEVSKSAGFVGPDGRGLGLAISDLDGDGKLDIYVANDATPDFLFRNLGGWKFEEVATEAGISVNGSGLATASMGVVADDLNGDGLIDLFITNFLNEPNTNFRNLGQGLFADVTLNAKLDAPSRSKTGFATAAIDADNDGRLDLFVANGHVDDQPWLNSPMAQLPQFFWGSDQGKFDLAPGGTGYFARAVVARGAAAGDLDNDGRVDLVVIHRDRPACVLRNRTPGGHWLSVQLRGTASSRTPVGARATCHVPGRSSVRWLTSGTGYLSAHDQRLCFGLGSAETVDRLEVRWPSGRAQSWSGVAADQFLEIVEGRETLRVHSRDRGQP